MKYEISLDLPIDASEFGNWQKKSDDPNIAFIGIHDFVQWHGSLI
jgi:hypothetical protein